MKLYREPEPITIAFHHGTPRYVEWRGATYTVVRLAKRWMAEGRWWHEPYRRLYLELETDRGILEVFRDQNETAGWVVGWKLSRIHD